MTQSFEHAGQTDVDRVEAIKRIAYERWDAEGRPDGRDLVHWLEAERFYFSTTMGTTPTLADRTTTAESLTNRPRGFRPRTTASNITSKNG